MIEIFTATSIGQRNNQEDSFLANNVIPSTTPNFFYSFHKANEDESPAIFGVFDGMGGMEKGEEASSAAANLLYENFVKRYDKKGVEEIVNENFESFLTESADHIHLSISKKFSKDGITGGTTFSAAVIFKNQLRFINIGDSPAFMHRKNRLEEISLRQNQAEYLKTLGLPSTQRDENILLHCLGNDPIIKISEIAHVVSRDFLFGDAFVLCTDGITNTISEKELFRKLKKRNILKAGRQIIKKAAIAKNSDNSTIIIIRKT